jgi:hypothetical protein
MQHAFGVGTEVVHKGLARMPAAVPVVELLEQFYGRAEPVNVGHADANPARCLAILRPAPVDQPPQRGIIPGGRI